MIAGLLGQRYYQISARIPTARLLYCCISKIATLGESRTHIGSSLEHLSLLRARDARSRRHVLFPVKRSLRGVVIGLLILLRSTLVLFDQRLCPMMLLSTLVSIVL